MARDRPLLRVAQITLFVVGTTLIIPVAVNIGTGGSPPGWLRPYVGWLWPGALACVVAVIALGAYDRLRPADGERSIRHPVGDPRNGPLALDQVARFLAAR